MYMKLSPASIAFLVVYAVSFLAGTHVGYAAGPIVRSGEEVTVEAQKILEGDFYALGGAVNLSGDTQYDAYIGGGTITINGPVKSDLTVVGGSVQVHGTVGDDVRVVAGDVVIAEPVEGDLVVFAGKVSVLSTASIKGDVLLMAGEAQIDGPVEGAIHGTVGILRVNTHVGGDISVYVTESFALGDATDVVGSVTYTGSTDVVRAQGAVIEGGVHKEVIPVTSGTEVFKGMLLNVFIVLFAALSLFLVFRARITEYAMLVEHTYGRQGLVGFGIFFGVPFMATLLMASVIGLILGLAILSAYVVLILVSIITSCITLGFFIGKYLLKQEHVSTLSVTLGAITMSLLPFIPGIGIVLVVLIFLVTLGSVTTLSYRLLR